MGKEFVWEGNGPMPATVLFDTETRVFRLWYGVWNAERYYEKKPFAYNIAYAESADGLNWDRPALGVFDATEEDPRNNLIQLGKRKTQAIDVEANPKPGELPGRFIALHNDAGGLFVSTSEDGKSFQLLSGRPTIPYHSDTSNNIVYDEVRDQWLLYCRPRAYAGDHKRRVSVQKSDDLINWTHDKTILIPDEDEISEYYGMTVFRRGDLFFGLLQVYNRSNGQMHAEIAWSADGLEWHQIGTHPAVLGRGAQGEWDYSMVLPAESPVVVDDEMWFYYTGAREPHGGANETTDAKRRKNLSGEGQKFAMGLAVAGRDRLVGLRPEKAGTGFALTRPFARPKTGDLTINAVFDDLQNGRIKVELRDDMGRPIPGFTAEDCDAIMGSGFEVVVRWQGQAISQSPVDEIRLWFELHDATLFSYDFKTSVR
jgi:hypothetical protein